MAMRTSASWNGPSSCDDPGAAAVVGNPVESPVEGGEGQDEVRHWTESDSSAPTNKRSFATAKSVCCVPQGMSYVAQVSNVEDPSFTK